MVDQFRRWWFRAGLLTLAGLIALGFGWWLRQSQAALITEVFAGLAAPFIAIGPSPQEIATVQSAAVQARIATLDQENRQLRTLLKLDDTLGKNLITAQVVGRSGDHWWQEIVVDRGSLDGVQSGAAVMGVGGLVGQVTQVSDHASRILLLSDPTSQVGVMVTRTRVMGVLQGRRREKATAEFFEATPAKPGDLLVTSGLSSRFPAGLPIGKVVHYDRNHAAPQGDIVFGAPLGHLEFVKIYPEVRQNAVLPGSSTP
jgi:rod shape-determining protein MreC